MKPLLVLARITFVGCLWSIIFIEGVRVIMLENWHFDIFWPPHWLHAWNLWSSGWVIDTPKEWAFILIIVAFIPLWLTGWIALSLIPWEFFVYKLLTFPVRLIRSFFYPLKIVTKTPVVVKKKSYKEIRPAGRRTPIYDYNDTTTTSQTPASPVLSTSPATAFPAAGTPNKALKEKTVAARETFSHSLFNLDDEDDDFELDFDSFEKSDIFATKSKKDKSVEDERGVSSKGANSDRETFDFDEEERPRSRTDRNDKRDGYREEANSRRRPSADEDDAYSKPRRSEDRGSRDDRRDNRRDSRRDDTRRNEGRRDDSRREDRRRNDRKENYESDEERRRDRNAQNKNDARSNRNNREFSENGNRPVNPIYDVLSQKGFDIISGATIKNTIIDFIGVAEGKIRLCLVDKEAGDWLADEERFNDEEPLWFSESSHRISPVRKVDLARQVLINKLKSYEFEFDVKAYVIIQMGNIINAEDMFEVWNDLDVEVTRINRGSPKEIKLFSKYLDEAEVRLEKSQLENLKKLIRSIS